MRQGMRVRFRIFAVVLPIVVLVVVLSGVFSSLQSRTALTRIANRHMVFKAEQLRDYFYSEWEVVAQLGLAEDDEYRRASRQSFRSYAYSLLRSTTEAIYVFGGDGKLEMQIGLQSPVRDGMETSTVRDAELPLGWFTREIEGEARVGVAFEIAPHQWTVEITELESAFFSEVRGIGLASAILLSVAVALATLALSVFVGRVVGPVERLTETIQRVGNDGDLEVRAQPEFDDEVGYLAEEFNGMLGKLSENYQALEKAQELAVSREEETLLLLGRVSDVRDEETGAHLRRIGTLSELLARLMGLDEDEQRLMYASAPLHDIGKIGIAEKILEKKGKLTKREFEVMKEHTIFGYELLQDSNSQFLTRGAEIAYTHHEQFDGSGYPRGLKGEDIPLCGRIVALVDVFDALTSERPYKHAWTPEHALEYILGERGKHFDPSLVDLFEANFDSFKPLVIR